MHQLSRGARALGGAARLAERTADRHSTARKQAAIVPERRPDPVPDSEARVLADETVLAHEYLQPNPPDKAALESPEANVSAARRWLNSSCMNG